MAASEAFRSTVDAAAEPAEGSTADAAGATTDVVLQNFINDLRAAVDQVADATIDLTDADFDGGAAVVVTHGLNGSQLIGGGETFGAIAATITTATPDAAATSFMPMSIVPQTEAMLSAPPLSPPSEASGVVWMTGDLGTFSSSSAGTSGGTTSGGSFIQGGSAGSGLVININWDASVANAPVGFQAGVESVVSYFDKVTSAIRSPSPLMSAMAK